MNMQRGGFVLGLVAGLLVGLALALGVALYITKAPMPFVNKVPQRTAEQDQAELERNKTWDPNALLNGKPLTRPAVAASAPAVSPAAALAASLPGLTLPPPPAGATTAAIDPMANTPAPGSLRDPAAILAGVTPPGPSTAATPIPKGGDAFVYFVQAGAYTRAEEAEQQRAKLAMMGLSAKVTEREQAGRTVYRVRLGPFDTRGQADNQQGKLQQASIAAQLVRVDRP